MGNRRFGLSFKFILIIVLFLVLIFFAFSYSLVRFNVRSLSSNLVKETKSFTELATPPIGEAFLTYQDSGRIRISQVVQRYADLNSSVTNFSIYNAEGILEYIHNDQPSQVISDDEATSFVTLYDYSESGNITRVVVPHFEESGVHRYSVVYDVSDASIQEVILQQIKFILVFTILGMFISIIVFYGVVDYNFIQPMKKLSKQALAISDGNIDKQIEIKRHDEVSDLAKSVNIMAGKLKEDIRKLKELDELKSEFLVIVSHNLRTPLTIIRGYLDNAQEVESLEEMKPILEKLNYGSKELSVLAEDMITIAELESGQSIGNRKNVEVAPFVKSAARDFAGQMYEMEIKYVEEVQEGGYKINVNQSLIRGALWSLLDNAVKFTKPGGTITLTTIADKETVKISIADTGIGISKEEIPKLFTKFHRGTSVMAYNYEGTGVGLYSSDLVIKEHGGKIEVESELEKGSTFTITLPIVT